MERPAGWRILGDRYNKAPHACPSVAKGHPQFLNGNVLVQLNDGDGKTAYNSGKPHVAMQQLQVSRAIAHLTEPREPLYIWSIERRGDRVTPERNREMAKSFLRIALDNFVEARQRRANLYANGALQTLDDSTLQAMGLNREELRRKPSLRSIS